MRLIMQLLVSIIFSGILINYKSFAQAKYIFEVVWFCGLEINNVLFLITTQSRTIWLFKRFSSAIFWRAAQISWIDFCRPLSAIRSKMEVFYSIFRSDGYAVRFTELVTTTLSYTFFESENQSVHEKDFLSSGSLSISTAISPNNDIVTK